MSRSRINHATIMQDKSLAFGRYITPIVRISEPAVVQRLFPRRKQTNLAQPRCASCVNTICIKCKDVVSMEKKIKTAFALSETATNDDPGLIVLQDTDLRVEKIRSLVLGRTASTFPNNETLARIFHTLNTLPPSKAKTTLIHSLYSKSAGTNGEPSLHLRNTFLTHLLQSHSLEANPFEHTPQSVLQEYTDPLSRHSTVLILVAHTTIEKLFVLVKRMPVEMVRARTIQLAICARASRGDDNSDVSTDGLAHRRVMKVMGAIRSRCELDPSVLARFKHPHALLSSYTSIASVAQSCTSVESLRYVIVLVKEREVVEERDVVAVWRAGKKFGDEIVCAWAEMRMSGVQLLVLNWGRVRRLAKSYSVEDETVKGLDTGFNLMDLDENDESEKESVRRIKEAEFLVAKSDLENAFVRVKSNNDVDDAINVLNAL